MSRVLIKHEEIRQWAEGRAGSPMMMDVPDVTGTRTLLQMTFGQHALNADHNEGPDPLEEAYQLVGWDEWLAEFDRQNLAIRVRDEIPGVLDNDFEFISRDRYADTTDAARKPPAISMDRPD